MHFTTIGSIPRTSGDLPGVHARRATVPTTLPRPPDAATTRLRCWKAPIRLQFRRVKVHRGAVDVQQMGHRHQGRPVPGGATVEEARSTRDQRSLAPRADALGEARGPAWARCWYCLTRQRAPILLGVPALAAGGAREVEGTLPSLPFTETDWNRLARRRRGDPAPTPGAFSCLSRMAGLLAGLGRGCWRRLTGQWAARREASC